MGEMDSKDLTINSFHTEEEESTSNEKNRHYDLWILTVQSWFICFQLIHKTEN